MGISKRDFIFAAMVMIAFFTVGCGQFQSQNQSSGFTLTSAPSSPTPAPSPSPAPAATGIAFGEVPDFTFGNTLYDTKLTALESDGNEIHRKFEFMVGYSAWANNSGYLPFANTKPTMDALYANGYGIVFTWSAQNYEVSGNTDPNFNYSAIIIGKHDAFIHQWAHDAAAWGHVFYLRVFHEMNGDWYPWGLNVNGNTPALEVQAWRHVHDIFVQEGAANVKFMWCPNVRIGAETPDSLASFYPGDAYVDWLSMDGYNNSSLSFAQVFQATYSEMLDTVNATKPILIAETATLTDKANWITEMQNDAPTLFPNIKAIAYYNSNIGGAYHFDSDSTSLGAMSHVGADSRWQASLP